RRGGSALWQAGGGRFDLPRACPLAVFKPAALAPPATPPRGPRAHGRRCSPPNSSRTAWKIRPALAVGSRGGSDLEERPRRAHRASAPRCHAPEDVDVAVHPAADAQRRLDAGDAAGPRGPARVASPERNVEVDEGTAGRSGRARRGRERTAAVEPHGARRRWRRAPGDARQTEAEAAAEAAGAVAGAVL